MNNLRKTLSKNKLIKQLSSIKITVVCLAFLFILTLWGTIAQVQQGLYGAQERFFYSWFFLAGGFFPFPGAKLVLWILFINLVCVSITRFVYKWSHLGIIIIHIGLISYFVAAFVTYQVAVESNVTLKEGEGTNVSTSYQKWELSIWPHDQQNLKKVTALDINHLQKHESIHLNTLNITVRLDSYYKNAHAFTGIQEGAQSIVNQSGIQKLREAPLDKEPEKNLPGGIFTISGPNKEVALLLYGGERGPNQLAVADKQLNIQLRRKRYPLPFFIKLRDFQMEVHPGTETAKSYKSLVTIEHNGLSRDVLIWMNHPLRFKDYTLYQASYSIDRFGRQYSTLAVVKNAGRLLPYIASFITFFGLLYHFLNMGLTRKSRHA